MVDGGIVVTTPQRLAVQEAKKVIDMFRTLAAGAVDGPGLHGVGAEQGAPMRI